jgi:SAM domain (Sterile alpha motif)/Adenylate and Guanylate cyclase catalytic domain
MDVGAWLRDLGLGQYEDTFRASEIESDILQELTETDLEKLGLPLGPRKRILKAIQNLGDADKTSEAVSPARPAPARDTGERRQLTVMFCDLVGSTAISARLDPEDLSSVLSAFQKACVSAVSAFGGSIAKYMGDGALVYFGYPEAHEDDAERAVRAGLALLDAVAAMRLPLPVRPQVRVGIATGFGGGWRIDRRRRCARTGRRRRDIEFGGKNSGCGVSGFRGGGRIDVSSCRCRF